MLAALTVELGHCRSQAFASHNCSYFASGITTTQCRSSPNGSRGKADPTKTSPKASVGSGSGTEASYKNWFGG